MKQIFLVNSPFYSLVDDEDYDRLNKFRWYLHVSGYVWRYHGDEYTFMHHDVIGFPPDGMHVDHVNQNKRDNFKSNLRIVTRSVSMQNRGNWNKWRLRGVTKLSKGGRFQAKIQFNGTRIFLGTFDTPEEAARAYDKKAVELYGNSAATNYSKEGEPQ